jgi:hypothetical protein
MRRALGFIGAGSLVRNPLGDLVHAALELL